MTEKKVKKAGYYYGTVIDNKWWRRYYKGGFMARGNGSYWIDDDGLYFLRYLTKTPIFIPFSKVKEITTGPSHAGRWTPGATVIKIIWEDDGKTLSSGFRLALKTKDTMEIVQMLQEAVTS
ncbi:MAG: hypothetical protein GX020_06365 [Firmicutes bacterium]|nr:hypothetical protein [Bacillota bacterium]